ncbi:hypothetical protein ACEPAG_856 [Sanghuangporus baumii]
MTRQLGRANIPPSGDALNALDLALKEAVPSSVSAANGTASAALDSAASPSASASAIPSATGSDAISASASASVISTVGSSVSESARSAISSASAVSQSVVESATPSASSAPSQEVSSAAPIPTSSVASAASRSASSSDLALSLPKNAAAVSSSSTEPAATPAPSTPASSTEESAASPKTNAPSSSAASPAPNASVVSTEKNASPKTKITSSSEAAASTSVAAPAPSTSSVSSTVKPETTSSTAPVTSASIQVQPSPSTQVSSSSSNAVSVQRAQASSTVAATPSNRNEQASSSGSSDAAAPQPTSAASQPQAIGTSNQVQNSPSNANLRGSQPSVANSPSTTNLGNSLIGASPSTSVHVDSTLSIPQAVTFFSGSSTFVTTPAIFTSISVSSGKDGIPLATFTSVFANPTILPQTASLSDSSFWDKKGAVAGVFTAVGLIMLASILGTFYLCRRQRRKTGRPFAKSAQFHRFSGPPEMAQQPTTYQPVRPRRFPTDDPQRYLLAPSITSGHSNGLEDPATMRSASLASSDAHQPGALGLTGLLATASGGMQDYHGPFSDYHRYISTGDTRLSIPSGEAVGMAVTTDFSPKESKSEREGESGPVPAAERCSTPSPAPSSPSIYPPSLPIVPETDEDDYLFYERETKRSRPESQLPTPPPRAVVNDAPDPRNPFLDPVYDSAHKQTVSPPQPRIVTNQAYRPLTPPDSSAGHSPSTPQFSEPSESTKSLNAAPYSNTFLGRSVSMRTEPLPRPKRSPLRLSASGASLHQNTELP